MAAYSLRLSSVARSPFDRRFGSPKI